MPLTSDRFLAMQSASALRPAWGTIMLRRIHDANLWLQAEQRKRERESVDAVLNSIQRLAPTTYVIVPSASQEMMS